MSKNTIILDIDGRRFACTSGTEAAKIADALRKLQPLKWQYDGEESYYTPEPDSRIEITFNGIVEKQVRARKEAPAAESTPPAAESVPDGKALDLESSTNREG